MNLSANDQIRIRVQVRNQWITPEQAAAQYRITVAEVDKILRGRSPIGREAMKEKAVEVRRTKKRKARVG